MKAITHQMKFSIFLIAALCWSLVSNAQGFQDEWTLEKQFKLYPTTQVEISNKYGMFHIHEWDKDSLKVEIKVSVNQKSEEKLAKIRSGIDFSFVDNQHYIVVETKLTAVNFIDDLKQSVMNSDAPVVINYNIYVPSNTKLKLINKYGDIYMGDHSGELDVELSYGKFKASNINSSATFDLVFASASVDKLNKAYFDLSYSDFDVETVSDLSISSKSSKIIIGNAEVINANSKRDKINVNMVSNLELNSAYSDLFVKDVKDELLVEAKYGDMDIRTNNPQFKSFNITSKFTDIVLGFNNSTTTYNADLTCKNTRLTYPRSLAHLKEDLSEVKDKIFHYVGWMGKTKPASTSVWVKTEYGSLLLLHK